MVASSPVRHESPIGMTPLEVQAYQPPWKALSEFALHTDLERLDPNAPSFHHLVSQVIIFKTFNFLFLQNIIESDFRLTVTFALAKIKSE